VSLMAKSNVFDDPVRLMMLRVEVLRLSRPGLAGVPVETWIEPLACTPLTMMLASWRLPIAGLLSQAALSTQAKVVPLMSKATCKVAWAGGAPMARASAVSAQILVFGLAFMFEKLMPLRDKLPTVASNGAKRMLWRYRLKMPPSISFVVSSA
jgi:hypothetical protein